MNSFKIKRATDYPRYRDYIKENCNRLNGLSREEKKDDWLCYLDGLGYFWDEHGNIYGKYFV